jgi:hypothetical protein
MSTLIRRLCACSWAASKKLHILLAPKVPYARLNFDGYQGAEEEWTQAYLVVRRSITTTKATQGGAKDGLACKTKGARRPPSVYHFFTNSLSSNCCDGGLVIALTPK